MQLSEIRASAYDYLGTDEIDPEFPPAKLNRHINTWLNSVYADLPSSLLVASALLTVDSGFEHRYSFLQQSPAITTFRRALEVRLVSDTGTQLFAKPIDELESLVGPFYAITGADQVAVLSTATVLRASEVVFLRYAFWPAKLVDDNDAPDALPERFHNLAALGAAELGFTQGGESRFPATYADLLTDGRAQLLSHLGRRSLDVTTRRNTDARPR